MCTPQMTIHSRTLEELDNILLVNIHNIKIAHTLCDETHVQHVHVQKWEIQSKMELNKTAQYKKSISTYSMQSKYNTSLSLGSLKQTLS